MTELVPTAEQEAIFDLAVETKDNLIVQALAGAAKTSTLVMIADRMMKKSTSMLFLAFNKSIATEAQERMPSLCNCSTLNAFGHKAWAQQVGKKYLSVDKKKLYDIMKEKIEEHSKPQQKAFYDGIKELNEAVNYARNYGWIPDGHYEDVGKPVLDDEAFWEGCEYNYSQPDRRLIKVVVLECIAEAFRGHIDFADQVYMPALFSCRFPQYPLVMVDEAQDLSELNHRVLKKIAKKRLIAVGDSRQAIYAFRGALSSSMDILKREFDMRELTLTVSFRCSIAVVQEARWHAPQMEYPDWAVEGSVNFMGTMWDSDHLPASCAILCRNNAPLLSLTMKLLQEGRACEFVGRDVMAGLMKNLKSLGKLTDDAQTLKVAVKKWYRVRGQKVKNPNRVDDEYKCMQIFLAGANNLREAIIAAEKLFSQTGPIRLMTGHKSKGLEFETVFILDKHLLRVQDSGQDGNLLYVMQTRAKDRLTYIETPEKGSAGILERLEQEDFDFIEDPDPDHSHGIIEEADFS